MHRERSCCGVHQWVGRCEFVPASPDECRGCHAHQRQDHVCEHEGGLGLGSVVMCLACHKRRCACRQAALGWRLGQPERENHPSWVFTEVHSALSPAAHKCRPERHRVRALPNGVYQRGAGRPNACSVWAVAGRVPLVPLWKCTRFDALKKLPRCCWDCRDSADCFPHQFRHPRLHLLCVWELAGWDGAVHAPVAGCCAAFVSLRPAHVVYPFA